MMMEERFSTMFSHLNKMFNPKSIAVVGAKQSNPTSLRSAGMFGNLQRNGYKGRLYPINSKSPEINGIKAYPDLFSLPEQVDLVVVAVPAPAVPQVLRDCAKTENKNVHIFTAGFKETGEPDSLKLQKEIEEIAFGNQLRVIGPNCMGICVPEIKMATWPDPVKKVGPVTFVSQSGGHAQDFSNYASKFGIGFSKIISFGNALTIDSTDYLEYLADDPKTDIITMYIEGVKDGRKLLNTVKRINKTKPILILKGGLTKSGTQAVASHTGSLAGEEHFWNAFFRQTGAVRAYSLEDMAHSTLALLRMKPPKGRGVAVFGSGGGVVVGASDACSKAGLDLPPFSQDMQKLLRTYIPAAGNMIKNPLDAHAIFLNAEDSMPKTMDMIYKAQDIHMVIISVHMDWISPTVSSKLASVIKTVCPKHLKDKPFGVCWRNTIHTDEIRKPALKFEKELIDAHIPIYRSFEHAANSLARLADYHLYQENVNEPEMDNQETAKLKLAS